MINSKNKILRIKMKKVQQLILLTQGNSIIIYFIYLFFVYYIKKTIFK